MSDPSSLQDRMVLITIFRPSDTKHREPLQIRGRVAYIGELADKAGTLEIELEAKSVTLPVERPS
jgi:hypothetical protein